MENESRNAVIALLLLVPQFTLQLWVTVQIWSLYMVPLGLPEITKLSAFGLTLITGVVVSGTYKVKEASDPIGNVLTMMASSLFGLLIAYLGIWIFA